MLKDVYENYNIEGNLEKIKSCPFCGGKGILIDNEYEVPVFDSKTGNWTIDIEEADILWCVCADCGSEGESAVTPEKAISNWNRRIQNE